MRDAVTAMLLGLGALGLVLGDALFRPQLRFLGCAFRRPARVQFYWRTGLVQFPVWAPISAAGYRWPRYQARWYSVPWIWTVWLVRGLRLRLGWAARGRAVTVSDMVAFHPGKPWRCLCRGEGIVTSWRGKERGGQFCAVMLAAFRLRAGFRVVNGKDGPRWVAGYEPEKLVGPAKEATRG